MASNSFESSGEEPSDCCVSVGHNAGRQASVAIALDKPVLGCARARWKPIVVRNIPRRGSCLRGAWCRWSGRGGCGWIRSVDRIRTGPIV